MSGVDKFHNWFCPKETVMSCVGGAVYSRDEYMEWKTKMEPIIARKLKSYAKDEDAALEFLLLDGWVWKECDGEKVLVSPHYSIGRYSSYMEAVELELWYIEYARFRQNKLEEKAGEQVRNCVIDRG